MIVLPECSHIYTFSGIWLFYQKTQKADKLKPLMGYDISTRIQTHLNHFLDMIILPEVRHI